MKVLALCDHFSAASSGGAERVATEVYSRLVGTGNVDLTVLAVLRSGHEALGVPGARVVGLAGHDLSGVVGAELLLARGLRRRALALHDETSPDLIHANGLHFQGSAVAAWLARRTGTPLVTTAHLGDLGALSPKLRVGGTVWDATLGAWILRTSATTVAVSHSVAEHVARLGADRVVVAPNGVDHDRYRPAERPGLRDPRQPLRAVFVGRLIDNKGPQVAVEALAIARRRGLDVTLDVLGDGPLRTRLEARAADLGVAAAVTFHGHVGDVGAHLRRSDVLLRPSYTEGLPLAVLEGMACGLPVICSTVPGNTEVVQDGRSGLHTPPGDPRAVADALTLLGDDRERLHRYGSAAIAVARAHTWERSAQVHHDAFLSTRSRDLETTT